MVPKLMHYRFLVTFDKTKAKTSEVARKHVWQELQEGGFCGGGRWSHGLADWFVIGGRWSGELTRVTDWGRKAEAEIRQVLKDTYPQLEHGIDGALYGDKGKEELKTSASKEAEQIWRRHLPKDYPDVPYLRDQYKEDGYEDDAMLVTAELYEQVLKEHEGLEDSEQNADLDYEPISPEFIGKKWVVIVDYHT